MAKNAEQVKDLKKNDNAVTNLRAKHKELREGTVQDHGSYITLTGADRRNSTVLMHVCTGYNRATAEPDGCGFYSPLSGPKPIEYFQKPANQPKCPTHGQLPISL